VNGYAELDGDGKVPSSQLTIDAFQYLGTYDANTNTPTLIDGTGNTGDLYRVTVAGTQDFGSGNITFAVGDKVVYNPSSVWEKWDTDDSDNANRALSNLTSPTAVNQTLNTQDISVTGEVGINTAPVADVPLSIQASVQANNGIMTWTDSQDNDTWQWSVFDNGYLSLIKSGLTIRSLYIDATGRVGVGNTPTNSKFAVAWPQDVIQATIKGNSDQTEHLLEFTDGSNVVLSSVNADGSSEWPQIDVLAEGEVRFQDATGGEYMGLKAPTAVTLSTTLTLPDGDGTVGQVLSTNGSGILDWITPTTGGDLWSDPVDSDIVPTGNDNTYDLGDTTDGFATITTNALNVGKHGGGAIGLQNNSGSGSITGFITGATGSSPSGASVNVRTRLVYPNAAMGMLGDSNATADATKTGDLYIETGNKTAGTGDSGSINIYTGTSAGGTRGSINLADGSEGTIGHVWTSTGTAGEGNWAAAAGGGDLWSDPVDSDIVPDGANTRDLGTNGNRFAQAHIDQVRLTDGTFKGLIRATSIGMPSGDTTGVLLNARENLRLALYTIDNATADAVATGDVNIETGNKSAGTGDSGSIKMYTGTSAGGSRGSINLVDGSEGTIGHVWTSTGVNGEGNWEAASGGTPAADSIGSTEILFDNNTWLRWKNDPGGTSENVLKLDATERLVLGTNIFQFEPQTNGGADLGRTTSRWNVIHCNAINVAGDILPTTSATRDLGSASLRYAEVHATDGYIRNIQPTVSGSTTLNIRTAANTTTGNVTVKSGNGSAGNSGEIRLETGTATATRGQIVFSARQINHSQVTSTQVVWENGVTGSRPVSPVTGQRYFDTTLGIPIWYDGANWIDATGTTV
jgi:hypothetical protein